MSAAQIENRRYSIYIKNLTVQDTTQKISSETEQIRKDIAKVLTDYGPVVNVSVDGIKRTAIVRFR